MASLESLDASLLSMDGVEKRPSRFDRSCEAYWVDGVEFMHLHGADELDLRLTRATIREHRALLANDPRITLGRADWVVFRAQRADDWTQATELAHLACDANRPSSSRSTTRKKR